jgi:hypothetical protein
MAGMTVGMTIRRDAMGGRDGPSGRPSRPVWRAIPWALSALILALPLIGMALSREVAWDLHDFALAAILLLAASSACELAARSTGSAAFRAAVGLSVATALGLVWITLAVGVIGAETHRANLLFGGVLAVGLVGAAIGRFRPRGLARALAATALAQGSAGAIAIAAGWAPPGDAASVTAVLSGLFTALWFCAAWLFGKAAREERAVASQPVDAPRVP